MNKKQLFQFNLMKEIIVNGGNSLDRFILDCDFDEDQKDTLYNLLDDFSKQDNFSHHDFETKLAEELGINHNNIKTLIQGLHQDDRYASVVKQYITSNYQTYKNDISPIFIKIANELNILNSQ